MQWFEDKIIEIENLDTHMQKLHSAIKALVIYRKELSSFTGSVAKSAAVLSTCEEHTGLSRALSQLADVEVCTIESLDLSNDARRKSKKKNFSFFVFRKKSNCCDQNKLIPISIFCQRH